MTAERPDCGTPVYALFGSLDPAADRLEGEGGLVRRPVPFDVLIALESSSPALRTTALEHVRTMSSSPLLGATTLDDYWNGALQLLNPHLPRSFVRARALSVDKGKLYLRLCERGVSVPDYLVGALTPRLLECAATDLGPGAVLKPATGTGSRAVVRYRDSLSLQENLEHYRMTLRLAQIDSAADVIAMRYVGGDEVLEVSAEIVVDGGAAQVTVVHQKGTATEAPPFLDRIMTTPPTHSAIIAATPALDYAIASLVGALELDRGVLHAELRLEDGIWYVLDVGVRPGGGLVSHSVRAVAGVDLHFLQMLTCLGQDYPKNQPAGSFRAACIACCYASTTTRRDYALVVLNDAVGDMVGDPQVIGWHLSATRSQDKFFPSDASLSLGVGAETPERAFHHLAELVVRYGFTSAWQAGPVDSRR